MIIDNDPLAKNIHTSYPNLLTSNAQLHATEPKVGENGGIPMVFHRIWTATSPFRTLAKPQDPQNYPQATNS